MQKNVSAGPGMCVYAFLLPPHELFQIFDSDHSLVHSSASVANMHVKDEVYTPLMESLAYDSHVHSRRAIQ